MQRPTYYVTEELASLERLLWCVILNVACHGLESLLPLLDGVVDSWLLLSSSPSHNVGEGSYIVPWDKSFELISVDLLINKNGVRNMASAVKSMNQKALHPSNDFILKLLDSVPVPSIPEQSDLPASSSAEGACLSVKF